MEIVYNGRASVRASATTAPWQQETESAANSSQRASIVDAPYGRQQLGTRQPDQQLREPLAAAADAVALYPGMQLANVAFNLREELQSMRARLKYSQRTLQRVQAQQHRAAQLLDSSHARADPASLARASAQLQQQLQAQHQGPPEQSEADANIHHQLGSSRPRTPGTSTAVYSSHSLHRAALPSPHSQASLVATAQQPSPFVRAWSGRANRAQARPASATAARVAGVDLDDADIFDTSWAITCLSPRAGVPAVARQLESSVWSGARSTGRMFQQLQQATAVADRTRPADSDTQLLLVDALAASLLNRCSAQVRRQSPAEPCCICLDDMHLGQLVPMLACGHAPAHGACLQRYLQGRSTCLCPLCRQQSCLL